MDRRDDHVGTVVEQRNHLLGCGIGDAREAPEVAEPDDGVDALGDAAYDAAAEHAPSGVTAEIGLHQCPSHARERGRLDCQRKRRDHARERCNMGIGEAVGVRGHPRGVDTIHFTDNAFGREAVDHGDVFGHARCPVLPQDGELSFALCGHAAPQQALPGLQHAKERTCAPACGHLGLLAAGGEVYVRDTFRQTGAAVFLHDGLRRVVPPTDHAAFVYRVKRIDKHQRAADRQAGGNGPLAEPVHQRSFRLAAQTRPGQPRVQCIDAVLGNHADHPMKAASPLFSHSIFQTARIGTPSPSQESRFACDSSQLRSLCRLRQRSETLGQAVQLPGTRKVGGGCPGLCLVGQRGQRCRAVHRRDPAIKPQVIRLHRQLASFERLFERAVLAQQLRRTLRSTPLAPGSLSEGSPRRAMKSGTCPGSTP